MKAIIILFFLFLYSLAVNANHWLVLVNGERVFECVSTCSENGFNANLLMAKGQLKAGDKITIVYIKDSNELNITKNIIVSDSAQLRFNAFPVFDAAGNQGITINADDLNSLHRIIIWYSEKKMVNNKEIITQRIPLVYFE